jgi:hypothetical protein
MILGPRLELDRAKASTACPTCGLPANSTTSGVLKFADAVVDMDCLPLKAKKREG